MNLQYPVQLLLLWVVNFIDGIPVVDVTYDELEKLGASCDALASCEFPRYEDILTSYNCHCGAFCSQLGTCCIDSPHRQNQNSKFQVSCKSTYGEHSSHYFMEDACPSSSNNDGVWENLCKNSDDKDLLSLVPVTSFSTNMTYKNYFCFRCNERGGTYRFWSIKILSDIKSEKEEHNNFALTYSTINQTWVAGIGDDGSIIPVTFSIDVHNDIQNLPKQCVPNVISSCSEDWKDSVVYQKCNAYTSIIYVTKNEQTISYRNPHCALCNSENSENMLCILGVTGRESNRKAFSFTHVLDINTSDGELVGKSKLCNDGFLWDPIFRKCRPVKCYEPDHVVQNGKCIPH